MDKHNYYQWGFDVHSLPQYLYSTITNVHQSKQLSLDWNHVFSSTVFNFTTFSEYAK